MLEPLLFLLYINDLTCDLESDIRLYADDALLCKVIYNDDAVAFQTDINRMAKLAEKWKVVFNVSKCIHLEMGNLTPTHHFCLNGQIIPQGTSVKYLGVKIDS